jgi:hypothetical protein
MSEKIIEGYQPSVKVRDGYQPATDVQKGKERLAPMSTPVATIKVIPPKGGTGETTLNKK